jgi:selenide, water dikinase
MRTIVCVGGGHCNCQVLKRLKKLVTDSSDAYKMILVSETATSYYSGMLPGTVAGLYTEKDLQIELGPLSTWSGAEFIQARVNKIVASENKLILDNGNTLNYDVLCLNIGSKTKDS